ncbi:DB domain-containing protein [Aphelenchoides besseyi]|nr:DB domain-containing protein [Aphelenchoides besseyi]KAI6232566.1 DB domain-containing protein [Aphelenchoides besseyi]
MNGLRFVLLATLIGFVVAQELADPRCGTAETDYAPCVEQEKADALFQHCCRQYAPEGCLPLCQYETDELKARNLHISTVLYCASQNQDNKACCSHLNLADSKLGVGNRCLRFCDPSGETISSISRADVSCLFNWNILTYCHRSGLKLE